MSWIVARKRNREKHLARCEVAHGHLRRTAAHDKVFAGWRNGECMGISETNLEDAAFLAGRNIKTMEVAVARSQGELVGARSKPTTAKDKKQVLQPQAELCIVSIFFGYSDSLRPGPVLQKGFAGLDIPLAQVE